MPVRWQRGHAISLARAISSPRARGSLTKRGAASRVTPRHAYRTEGACVRADVAAPRGVPTSKRPPTADVHIGRAAARSSASGVAAHRRRWPPMKRITPDLKMRVLGAIEFAPGGSIVERIKHLSDIVFTDE